MKSFCRHLYVVLAVLLLAGCKSNGPTSMPPSVKEDALRFFGRDDVEIFWVPSSGSLADATFNTVSKANGSNTSLRLAKLMGKGAFKPTFVAVSGPNGAKVRRVMKDAFEEQTTKLNRLMLLYIGEPQDLEELEKQAVELGIRFHYIAKMPGVLSGKVKEPANPEPPPEAPAPAQ